MSSIEALLDQLQAGERLFIPGGSGEPRPLVEAIAAAAPDLPALEITHNFLPGINDAALAAQDNALREVAFFPRAGNTAPARVRTLPLTYYGACQYLQSIDFDRVVVHVSPPDSQGQCSLGTSVEFTRAVLHNAGQVTGIINRAMPGTAGAPQLPLSMFDSILEVDWPIVNYEPGPPDDISIEIARHLSSLIEDHATLQVGIGRVPSALLEQLSGASGLRLHGGLFNEGFRTLTEAGALAEDKPHVGCTALGTTDYYHWFSERRNVQLVGVEQTHDPGVLAGLERFTAINSALEIDLLGQANLETAAAKPVSGVGGSPDFCRGARYSRGGKSIIALPSTTRNGDISRIVADFPAAQPVSLGRQDIDYVVTEHGVAELVNKTAEERAQALVAVAAPQFRESLEQSRKA